MTDEMQAAANRGWRRSLAWAALLALPLVVFSWVALPVYVIRPFAPQTPGGLRWSYALRGWSGVVTIVALIAAAALVRALWRGSRKWWRRALLVLPLLPLIFFAWFARQNHFEWMFSPLAQSAFASAEQAADFVAAEEMVMAVEVNGDAVAFPVRQIAYHHIAQDTAGGVPIVATY